MPYLANEIGELQKEIDSAIEAAVAKRKLRGRKCFKDSRKCNQPNMRNVDEI